MNTPAKPNSLQTYQVILYNRALHPEFFPLKARKVFKRPGYELEAWIMPGSHLLRFEHGAVCASELMTDQEKNLPANGIVTAFLCAGERDYEYTFPKAKVTYMCTVQTETLSENLYSATYGEILDAARHGSAVAHRWADEVGPCLSVVEVEPQSGEVHCHAYHMLASQGLVVRTQAIFEVTGSLR